MIKWNKGQKYDHAEFGSNVNAMSIDTGLAAMN